LFCCVGSLESQFSQRLTLLLKLKQVKLSKNTFQSLLRMKFKVACGQRTAQQINGREAETATYLSTLSVKGWRAWRLVSARVISIVVPLRVD
jgi:hypothetical protein